MKKTSSFAIAAALLASIPLLSRPRIMPLDSSDGIVWQVMPQDIAQEAGGRTISTGGFKMVDAVPGVVPGTVFTAYVEAGREADPNFGSNIYNVDETFYNRPFWYRTEFTLPSDISSDGHVWLCFDNTNRFADFWFNGHKISGTDDSTKDVSGHMLRSKFDVTALVDRQGTNTIAVLIYDPDQKKTRDEKGPYGVACSPSYLAAAGWDWMPYVPGRLAGITGHVYLSLSGEGVLRDPWVRSFLPDNGHAELTLSSDVVNAGSEPGVFTVRGTIAPVNASTAPIFFSKTVAVRAHSKATVKITKDDCPAMAITDPQLWWPNGYGDPNLYSCSLECVCEDGTVSDEAGLRFGIRRYDYRIEKNNVDFPVLNIWCNGQRIFCRGGNWGMSEYLLRCHGSGYETKIRLHKEMNMNMIRLWTGCVTDDEFYDYCDEYGIMVWDDFWLYFSFNDVVQHDAFKINARDKVRRLRNHPSIAVWCGANETHPVPDIDQALRMIVMEEDGNDRLYKSCSNQDAQSGSGWWKDMTPRHHFSTSASNLAFNKPPYPYGSDHGYGFRSEIGMATFPTYESVCLFIPEKDRWPLPSDEDLKDNAGTVWNHHFFGKEASNAAPVDYKHSVDDRYGPSSSLEEFCEKAQLINLEDMKGMYEAWNDNMWEDASAILIWMSHPAYPSFVWQTYDYYYDPTGCYWGAKSACEPRHIQWNCADNSVKVINATNSPLIGARASAMVYDMNGEEIVGLGRETVVSVPASNRSDAFTLDFGKEKCSTEMQLVRLRLESADGDLISENTYWRNVSGEYDYRPLSSLPEAKVKGKFEVCRQGDSGTGKGIVCSVTLTNHASTVAFANRLRLVNARTGERILPAIFSDGYVTLLPGETRTIGVELPSDQARDGVKVLLKQYGHKERVLGRL